MRVKIWGVRGSIPTPGEETIRYGGNTPCVEVEIDSGDRFIFDCGTGAINLGKELMGGEFGDGKGRAYIFFSHFHWDHIMGIPFFKPLFVSGNRFLICGRRHIEDIIKAPYRNDFRRMGAGIAFKEITRRGVRTKDFKVVVENLNHPGGCWGYRVEADGKVFVYATDTEPYNADVVMRKLSLSEEEYKREGFHAELINMSKRVIELVRGADLLIFDTQYTSREYMSKIDWGHSTPEEALIIALGARAKRLVLFHHDPSHTDEDIDKMFEDCGREAHFCAQKGIGKTEVFAAKEGLEFRL
ncbi:MAG: MBL fold metallo-hydrolase [bacterium]